MGQYHWISTPDEAEMLMPLNAQNPVPLVENTPFENAACLNNTHSIWNGGPTVYSVFIRRKKKKNWATFILIVMTALV